MSIEIALHEHNYYSEMAPFWTTYRDLYDGNHATLTNSKYLWYHELEKGDKETATLLRGIRAQRTRYLNRIEPIISRYTSLFFQNDPMPDQPTLDMFGDSISDVTGTGKSLISFLKEDVLRSHLLYGRPVVRTDNYAVEVRSLAEQRALKISPTFEVINPLDLKDWQIDTSPQRRGKFLWVRCEYWEMEARASATDKPEQRLYSKVFTWQGAGYTVDTYVAKSNKDIPNISSAQSDQVQKSSVVNDNRGQGSRWELEETSGLINAPDLPIRSIENGESWVKDIAPQALKLFNLESTRDSIHYSQGHQRIWISGVTNKEQMVALSEYTIGFLPDGSQVQSLEPINTASIDANISETTNNILRIAFNQQATTTIDSKAVQSGATQQEGKEPLVALIKAEIESLENLANSMIKDYAFFKEGITDFQGKIKFSRDIKIDDIQAQLNIFNALRSDINSCKTWRSESLKKFARQQGLAQQDIIDSEIEASKPQDLTQAGAGFGSKVGAVLSGGR